MKRILFITAFICVAAFKVQAQPEVSYFIQADEDDWQLFMSKKVSGDLAAGGKAIMITLTAGDEGYGSGTFNAAPIAYYLAKEQGAVNSTKTISDISYSAYYPFSYPVPIAQTVPVNGKNITKYTYGNVNGVGSVVSYFLRLPDGGQNGSGFPTTLNKSLMKLKQGTIPNITSVDGVNTYTWNELVETILSIILSEREGDEQFFINTSNLNAAVNPGDHSDHIFSSTAAQEAVLPYLSIGINEFIFDHSSSLANNLSDGDYENSTAAFSSYGWGLISNKYPSVFSVTTRAWLHKEYSNIKRSPVGALPVSLLEFTGSLKDKKVLLEWSTSAEYNSKLFEIEKSSDGINFSLLGTLPAAGNSSTLKKYAYQDNNVEPINFYRLKMIDVNGAFKQSNVVIIKNNLLQQSILYVTNPFTDILHIRFAKIPEGEVSVKLIELSGREVFTSKISKPLSQLVHIETGGTTISKGIYMLHIETEGKQYNVKLLKD